MNKVFIDGRPLYLLSSTAQLAAEFDFYSKYSTLEDLQQSISLFENNKKIKTMAVLFESDVQKEEAIRSLFRVIEAAGGIVKNRDGNILFIFRHGKWDLPKGKIEKGEKVEEAALREVEEECGIGDLILGDKFTTSYHTYQLKGENALKISHWYRMNYSGKSLELTPQTEEGITAARWLNRTEIKEAMKNTFAAIADVMHLYLDNK